MSCETFVRARGLGKRFALYRSAGQRVSDMLFGSGSSGEHWALRNIDLDLRPGTCLGIVGRNGAGKSTLLELICGTSRASEGVIETSGRIAALLQLGAGFNPDFTGRENVLLGASLYGLTEAQIRERFADIEVMAEIGDFIDRPVREYSSGMYARLAFAVCAQVDADILVIDEILGIGDVAFQQKSMRFLRRFRRTGIVLFVSHDEHAVAALCDSAIWIEGSRIVARGDTKDVLYQYRREMQRLAWPESRFVAGGDVGAAAGDSASGDGTAPSRAAPALSALDLDDPEPRGSGTIDAVVVTADEKPPARLEGGERIEIEVTIGASHMLEKPSVLFALRNPMGQLVLSGDVRDSGWELPDLDEGRHATVRFRFDLPYLPTGSYPLEVFLSSTIEGQPRCEACRTSGIVLQILSAHISHGLANLHTETLLEAVGEHA